MLFVSILLLFLLITSIKFYRFLNYKTMDGLPPGE